MIGDAAGERKSLHFSRTAFLRSAALAELRGVLLNEHDWRQREGLDS